MHIQSPSPPHPIRIILILAVLSHALLTDKAYRTNAFTLMLPSPYTDLTYQIPTDYSYYVRLFIFIVGNPAYRNTKIRGIKNERSSTWSIALLEIH